MTHTDGISDTLSLETIMRRWPSTIRVLLRHRMGCVGCAVATYHTPVDAAREYGVELASLMAELRHAAQHGPSPD